MGLKSRVRQLRFELQTRESRAIPIREVADAIGVDRVRLNKIELGTIKEIKTEELNQLCAFFTKRLGRLVDTNEILEYDPTNKRAFDLVAA